MVSILVFFYVLIFTIRIFYYSDTTYVYQKAYMVPLSLMLIRCTIDCHIPKCQNIAWIITWQYCRTPATAAAELLGMPATDFSNIAIFSHNKMWRLCPSIASSTSQMLGLFDFLRLVTTNYCIQRSYNDCKHINWSPIDQSGNYIVEYTIILAFYLKALVKLH